MIDVLRLDLLVFTAVETGRFGYADRALALREKPCSRSFCFALTIPNAVVRAGTGECQCGDDLMGEETPVYQARGQALLYLGPCFAGMAIAGATALMRQG